MTNLASRYPWYERITDGRVTHGDLLVDCPIPVIDAAGALLAETATKDGVDALKTSLNIGIEVATVVVLTQACDLENGKVDQVVVCPVRPLTSLSGGMESTDMRNRIRKGEVAAYHMLNAFDTDLPLSVVDFRRIHSLGLPYASAIAAQRPERPRLLPPYREHLSQAFARFFMRVGLPVDIPAFVKTK